MAALCLLAEDGAVAQRWEIGDRPVAFGRDDTADVTIEDETLSRRHFLIQRDGDNILIKDLNSQNGTWVDGQRVQGIKLSHDVCIAAGRTLFMFSERPLSASTTQKTSGTPHDTAVVIPAAFAAQPAAGGTPSLLPAQAAPAA